MCVFIFWDPLKQIQGTQASSKPPTSLQIIPFSTWIPALADLSVADTVAKSANAAGERMIHLTPGGAAKARVENTLEKIVGFMVILMEIYDD